MLGNQGATPSSQNTIGAAALEADLVVFPIPSGFVPPQGIQPGEAFEAIAKVKYTNGKMVLESIEGHEVRLDKTSADSQKPVSFENAVERGLGASEGMA